jgi:hypothetical protein
VGEAIREVLRENRGYMKGTAIVDALKVKPTTELLGRVLRSLIARKLVFKRGLTRNSEYILSAFV